MNRMEKVLQSQGMEDNSLNRGHLVCFKCPHNYPCINYFDCDNVGMREVFGEYDDCNDCWLVEID